MIETPPESPIDTLLQSTDVQCPYCGERFEATLDLSAGAQHYIEDCRVCCRPIEFILDSDPGSGEIRLELKRDDD